MVGKTLYISTFFILILSSFAYADLMAFQGKALDQGVLVDSGNITVSIYDAASGGTQVYQQSFPGVIQGGFFDVVLGNSTPLNLEYGQNYWVDLSINGNDIDWQGQERKVFESGIGDINQSVGWLRSNNDVILYSISDNVGIGISSPSYKLDVNGTGRYTGTVIASTINLTDPESIINFDNGANLITLHDGFGNFNIKSGVDKDNIIISTSGGSHLRLDENGYIGLMIDETTATDGTFSTTTGLTINAGAASVTGDLEATGEIRQGGADYGGYEIQTGGQIYSNDYIVAMGGMHVGGTSDPGTDNLIVDGRIGIGTSPSEELDIQGTSIPKINLQATDGDSPGIEVRSNGGGTPYIDFSRDGSTDYHARIGLYNDYGSPYLRIISDNFNLDYMFGEVYFNAGDLSYGDHSLSIVGSGQVNVNFDGAEYSTYGNEYFNWVMGGMTIGHQYNPMFSSGNTAHPTANLARLHIKGLTVHQGVFNQYVKPGWEQIGEYNGGAFRVFRQLAGLIVENGRVGFGTTLPSYKLHVQGTAYATGAAGALSDERHKKNISNIENGLDTILKFRPVSYEWKNATDDGMKGIQLGFIAQDVEKIVPSMVLTEPNEEQTKGLKYNEFIPILVDAVQEQQELIEELQSQNQEQKKVIDDLKSLVCLDHSESEMCN